MSAIKVAIHSPANPSLDRKVRYSIDELTFERFKPTGLPFTACICTTSQEVMINIDHCGTDPEVLRQLARFLDRMADRFEKVLAG